MGNIGSQSNHISQSILPETQWANSFPRAQPTKLNHQNKVLPERDAQQKLRSTDNGEILNSGGTLTGRQKHIEDYRPQYSPLTNKSFHFKETYREFREHRSRIQGVQQRIIQNAGQKTFQDQMRSFSSEPDLRYSSPNQEVKEKKSKKKYKAPPPPQNFRLNEKASLEWDENSSDNDFPVRKPRLYKTRAETKNKSSHVNKSVNVEYTENKLRANTSLRPNRLSLPELKIAETDEFQRELKEATKKLRHIHLDNPTTTKYGPSNFKDKLKTLDHNVSKHNNVKKTLLEILEDENKNIIDTIRGEPSGKESTTPETSPNLTAKDKEREQPKTFYYGMENNDVVDYFAANTMTKIPISSESDISTDIDSDENNITKLKIDLQLRPILPKKQLEIPRFSPAAAWRLLSSMESNYTNVTVASDDVPVFVEECIEKCARPPPPLVHLEPRSSNDKSGDSGISGDDAIPITCFDENPDIGDMIQENHEEATSYYPKRPERSSWTPQQDLGDDSSIEDCNSKPMIQKIKSLHSGPHVFSLSLPRDNQLAAYMLDKSNIKSSGLDKFRRSLSGVFSSLSNKKDFLQASLTDEESVNWFLTKSTSNSLSNEFHSMEIKKSNDQGPIINKSRLMYLPDTDKRNSSQAIGNLKEESKHKQAVHSKSCENINMVLKESLQDPPAVKENASKETKKHRKFTFQSTIRQMEKKRLSDKLSREAERREQKRLQEVEAMQKVEEEFQRKRAREKASIRQQLRLFCMDKDNSWSSLPANLETKAEMRAEPDGALSSYTSSPVPRQKYEKRKTYDQRELRYTENKAKAAATQELSEFRQTQRDYKDYRGNFKNFIETGHHKQTTVHPQVIYNMPKVKDMKAKGINYRKDFACGVKSTMSAESSYSEESQNNHSHMYNKQGSITRF